MRSKAILVHHSARKQPRPRRLTAVPTNRWFNGFVGNDPTGRTAVCGWGFLSCSRGLLGRVALGVAPQISHGSGHADFPHPARHLMTSLPARSVVVALTRFRSLCTCHVSLQRFMRRHPLPSPGSLRLVPPLQRDYWTLRLLAARFAALRFLRLAIPPLHPLFVPNGPGRGAADHPGVVHPVLHPALDCGNGKVSQVPGESYDHSPCSLTPA